VEPWTIEQRQRVFDGYVKIEQRTYRMPDGRTSDWDIIEGTRTVAAVARTREGDFIIVRQFRVGPNRVLGEVPGGYVDPGEDVIDAAARELREETGYVAESVQSLGITRPNPAFMTNTCHVFLATGCRLDGDLQMDPGEDLEVITLPLAELDAAIADGRLDHAIVLAALARWRALGSPGA
jgi:ADP-ribose pyrophosphatase